MGNLIDPKSILKFIFGLIITIIILEIVSKITTYLAYGFLKKPNEIIRDDNLNVHIEDFEKRYKCNYEDKLFPHSYLGWVHWNNPKCLNNFSLVNSDGFTGPEFPIQKNENFFDILITGGSVAQQFGPMGCEDKKNNFCRDFLGEALKRYISITDKEIRVFNAGAGAYKHPHQSIVATLFGQSFDLIISIEGFNEHYMLNDKIPIKLASPAKNINTNDFYINSNLNRILIKFILFYKNLPNRFYLLDKSHFHALSYRLLKKITETASLTDSEKKKNYSRMWNYEKSKLENINLDEFKYKNLVSNWKNFIGSSSSNGARAIVIIQPVPQLYKDLTTEEKQFTNHRDYKKIFLKMAEEAEKLRLNENLMVYDFLNIFEQYNETIYQDAIHINTKGNEIMASHLVDILILNKIIKKND